MSFRTRSQGALYLALVCSLSGACLDAEPDSHATSNATTSRAGSLEGATTSEDAGDSAAPPTAASRTPLESERSEPWRVVPLGDSITEQTCTSQMLWQKLRQAGAKNFDLVGTHHSDKDCGVDGADRDHEGHSGYRATDLVDDGQHAAELDAWCAADKADVVLMHLGTNDIAQASLPPETILDAYSKILRSLRAEQPNVTLFVAQIIPMHPSNCDDCFAQVQKLNEQIPAWAARENLADSPVYVVDQFWGFDTETDTDDAVHPNKQGSGKMADKWSAAILERLTL